jgi:hypothetical protein
MKKRLQSRVVHVSDPEQPFACICPSGATDGSHLNTIVSAKQFRQISKGNRKKKSYPLDRLLLRAALRRPSPLRYLGSDTIVRSPHTTNLISHRKSWGPCAHHGHMERLRMHHEALGVRFFLGDAF